MRAYTQPYIDTHTHAQKQTAGIFYAVTRVQCVFRKEKKRKSIIRKCPI